MKILAIETSCDETAVAVIEAKGDVEHSNYAILGNALYSQAALHSAYGGVYPALAKREHQKNLVPLTIEALTQTDLYQKETGKKVVAPIVLAHIRENAFQEAVQAFLESCKKPEIDLIAVTSGPGLEPALWSGITFAKTLATVWDIPVIGINHMEGHIVSALLKKSGTNSKFEIRNSKFPLLALLISGGHTEIILMKDWFEYERIGRTRDDAVGEAFDKVARMLGFPYPGGPEIDRAAERAQARGATYAFELPRPMIHDESCDFSFSGLKTAVLYHVRDMHAISEEDKENIALEFERAVRDVIVAKTKRAIEQTGARMLIVGGGVSANQYLREGLEAMAASRFPGVRVAYPGEGLTGDNAIMIGIAGYARFQTGKQSGSEEIVAHGTLSLA